MLPSLLLPLALGAAQCSLPPPELERQLSLPYAGFDLQQGQYGWRQLAASGCVDTAVAALQAYAKANAGTLSAAQRMEMSFHAGQALALAGRDADSIPYFEQALAVEVSAEWRTYVEATLAFLRHDARALEQARDLYRSIAPTSMRLAFIDGMLACPNEPYARAVHCSASAGHGG